MEPQTKEEARARIRELRKEARKLKDQEQQRLEEQASQLAEKWGIGEGMGMPVDEEGDPL